MLLFHKILFGCWMALLSTTTIHHKPVEKYDFVVAKDGSGDFTTIQSAIEACKAFPNERIRIYIKNGLYHEKILIPSWNTKISLIGESRDSTIISYDDYFNKMNKGRNSTFFTYTLLVEGNDFHAENLTIENTSGPVGQAVALSVIADRCSFSNCRFLGNQDTVYVAGENCRQYFVNCYIEGTTDFIFGEATALFENCTLNCKANSYITAASTPEGVAYGFVFKDCKIEAAPGVTKVYLGRPWRKFAKVVFINTEMGNFINPEGWSNWDKTDNYQTVYYAERNSFGAGAKINQRISWSHQLTGKEAEIYNIKNIFSGLRNWDPLQQNKQ